MEQIHQLLHLTHMCVCERETDRQRQREIHSVTLKRGGFTLLMICVKFDARNLINRSKKLSGPF